MSQPEKVVRGAFPNAQSELDRLLDETVIPELESFAKSMPGSGLVSVLFVAMLEFFREIKKDRTADGIKSSLNTLGLAFLYNYDELNVDPEKNPAIAPVLKNLTTGQILQLAARLVEAESASQSTQSDLDRAQAEIQQLKDEKFATDTALEQRAQETTGLRRHVERMRQLLIHARQAELEQEERMQKQVQPVLDIGQQQLHQLQQIQESLSGFSIPLATAITQLSGVMAARAVTATPQQPAKQPAAQPVQQFDPAPEIDRHQAWLAEADQLMEQLGDQRAEISNSVAAVGDLIKYLDADSDNRNKLEQDLQDVNSRIHRLLSLKEEVAARLRRLVAFQKAVETVKAGAPNDLLQSELPDLSLAAAVPPSAPSIASAEPSNELVGAVHERHRQLETLAENFQLTAHGVYVISLYYCLPANSQKAVISVVRAAEKAGLSQSFGLPKAIEVVRNWRTVTNQETAFLTYMGKFAGGQFSSRGKSIGWSPEQIFTKEEIAKFIEFVSAVKDK